MAERLSPAATKKLRIENVPENLDEETSWLRNQQSETFQRLRKRFTTNTGLIVPLIILSIILLLIIIIIAARWPKSDVGNICRTASCLSVAADVVGKSDMKSMPCDAPFNWACGRWLETNRKFADRAEWTITDEVKFAGMVSLRDSIATATSFGGPDSIDWKVKTLYDSCMNTDITEAHQTVLLKKIINELGGWHVLQDWSSLNFDESRTLELLHTRFRTEPLFSVSVMSPTLGDNASSGFLLAPAGLGLPDPSFYFAGFETKAIIAYKQLLQDVTILMGATSFNAKVFANDVLHYERRLAELLVNGNEHNSTIISTVTLEELTTEAQLLTIKNILTAMFPRVHFTNKTKIHIQSPFYIKRLNGVLYGADRGILNDYLLWQLVKQYLPYLSYEFRAMWQTFQGEITGAQKQVPRWEFCTNVIYKIAPIAVTTIVQKQYQSTEAIDSLTYSAIENIFQTIRSAIMELITDAKNISLSAKNNLLNLIANIDLKIGLQNEVDDSFVKDYHSKWFVQKGNFFDNIGFGHDFEKELLQNAFLDDEVYRKRSLLEALSGMSIKFDSNMNAISVPTILTQLPYYYAFHPRSVQYSRIGVPIATEMLKALSTQSDDLRKLLEYNQPCIQSAFETFASVNGSQLSLIGPAGMLHKSAIYVTVKALKVYLKDSPSFVDDCRGVRLPGLENYDEIQTFALLYAQTQCSYTSEQKMTLNFLDGKIDGKTLLQGTWPQIKEFAASFKCNGFPICVVMF